MEIKTPRRVPEFLVAKAGAEAKLKDVHGRNMENALALGAL
jgi:hypothetical protein